MSPAPARRGRTHPISLLALVVLVGALAMVLRTRSRIPVAPCGPGDDPADPRCAIPVDTGRLTPTPEGRLGPTLHASDVCPDAGYLCAELDTAEAVVVRRWTHHAGTLVVHVPLPPVADRARAQAIQRAATAGIRIWNNHPFPILVDERGTRPADIEVRWAPSLAGTELGVTRTQWSPSAGLKVLSIELVSRSPFTGRVIDPRQIRLTAAHEMGHALGLPHSDDPRDLMYPQNTATSLTAQDFRTLEVLYQLQDGTQIVP